MRPFTAGSVLYLGMCALALACAGRPSAAGLDAFWRQRAVAARSLGAQWRAALPACAAAREVGDGERLEGALSVGWSECTELSCRASLCCNSCRREVLLVSEAAPRRGMPLLLPRGGPARELFRGGEGLSCETSAWWEGLESRTLRLRMTWRQSSNEEGRRRYELLELCRLEAITPLP